MRTRAWNQEDVRREIERARDDARFDTLVVIALLAGVSALAFLLWTLV